MIDPSVCGMMPSGFWLTRPSALSIPIDNGGCPVRQDIIGELWKPQRCAVARFSAEAMTRTLETIAADGIAGRNVARA